MFLPLGFRGVLFSLIHLTDTPNSSAPFTSLIPVLLLLLLFRFVVQLCTWLRQFISFHFISHCDAPDSMHFFLPPRLLNSCAIKHFFCSCECFAAFLPLYIYIQHWRTGNGKAAQVTVTVSGTESIFRPRPHQTQFNIICCTKLPLYRRGGGGGSVSLPISIDCSLVNPCSFTQSRNRFYRFSFFSLIFHRRSSEIIAQLLSICSPDPILVPSSVGHEQRRQVFVQQIINTLDSNTQIDRQTDTRDGSG